MIYIGEDNISDLNDFLEASGKIKEINNFDEKIIDYENELNALESDRTNSQLKVSKAEEKLQGELLGYRKKICRLLSCQSRLLKLLLDKDWAFGSSRYLSHLQ